MIKVLLVDDHEIIRQGLRNILERDEGLFSIDEAADGRDALKKVFSIAYNVVVLDISLGDMDGIEVLKQIKREKPGIPVLILSINPEINYATRALKAGAAGYLRKDIASEELVKAIQKVVSGKRYITESVAEYLAEEIGKEENTSLHEQLSDREFQVFILLASGKTVGEIAKQMFLSVKTISTYRTRILTKMRLRNNAQLMSYAVKHHLVEH
ncbi:response regulator transcription factor [bacterium]|nr:response regulator transcription factor [bacterium]